METMETINSFKYIIPIFIVILYVSFKNKKIGKIKQVGGGIGDKTQAARGWWDELSVWTKMWLVS